MVANKYKDLVVNSTIFAINALATKLITFVLVPLYTTYLSAGDYGITDMSLTVISLLMPLVTLNSAEAAIRFIISDEKNGPRYAAVSLSVTFFSILVVAFCLPILDMGVFGGLGEYKTLFLAAYASSALMNTCSAIARGYGNIAIIPKCATISSLITIVAALYLIGVRGTGVDGYFISVSAGPLVATSIYLTRGRILSHAIVGFSEKPGKQSLIREIIHPMVSYAIPLIPNSLFWWAGTGINRFYITGMLGITASGMFAAASKIPNLLNTAYSIFQQAWQLSAFQEVGKEGVEHFYAVIFRILSSGLTVLCSLLSLLSPWVALIFLRGETYAAWPMIPILLIANLMSVFSSFYGTVYTATLHTTYIMRTTVFGAISCLILTPALIPLFGTLGACIASAIGQGLVFLMRAIDSVRYVKFDTGWKTLLPTMALLIVQALVASAQISMWAGISACCFLVILTIQCKRLKPIIIQIMKVMRHKTKE